MLKTILIQNMKGFQKEHKSKSYRTLIDGAELHKVKIQVLPETIKSVTALIPLEECPHNLIITNQETVLKEAASG